MLIVPSSAFTFPAIDGLHFSKRCVYPVLEEVKGRFTLGRSPMEESALSAQSTTLYPAFESPAGDEAHFLVGGGGAWEGEGFLAIVHRESREALWVLYVATAEVFVSASASGSYVNAVSSEYPFSTEWRVRANQPPDVIGVRTHVP
jgi:hypothetical protein